MEEKKKKSSIKRSRKDRLKPITKEETDRLVAEFLANGGTITDCNEEASNDESLSFRKTGNRVTKQLPWLEGAVSSMRREDREMTSDLSFD